MSPRERVLTALNRQVPDRVPRQMSFTPAVMDVFREKTGSDSPADYWDIELRGVGFKGTRLERDFSRYYADLPEGTTLDEWGIARVPGSRHHFVRLRFPLESATTVEEIEEYPWPDFMAPYRHEHLEETVRSLREGGYAVSAGMPTHNYVAAWQLRGQEQMLCDFLTRPDIAECLLDHTAEMSCLMAARYAEAGVDIIYYGEDIASQQDLLMSHDMWREWLKPRLAQVIASAKAVKPDLLFLYHSDGNITRVVPELIEIGVDVLNPIQPECMDVVALKREFGDQLAFNGGLSVQQTMPWGTPDDVRREVKHLIETVGEGGGLMIAPAHTIEPEVPWQNIVAFHEAVDEFGSY